MATVSLAQMVKDYKEATERVVVPAGTYTLEVIRCKMLGGGGRTEGLFPVYKVLDGPHKGKEVTAGQMSLTEKSKSVFYTQLRGFGLNEAGLARLVGDPPLQAVADALVGRVVKVALKTEVYNDEERNKLPISGITFVRNNRSDPVAAQLGGDTTQAAATEPEPEPEQAVAEPADEPEDDSDEAAIAALLAARAADRALVQSTQQGGAAPPLAPAKASTPPGKLIGAPPGPLVLGENGAGLAPASWAAHAA